MFYIDFIEPEFYEYLRDNEPLSNYLNKRAIGFMLIAEGLSSGLILSFIFMQHFKSYLYNKKKAPNGAFFLLYIILSSI